MMPIVIVPVCVFFCQLGLTDMHQKYPIQFEVQCEADFTTLLTTNGGKLLAAIKKRETKKLTNLLRKNNVSRKYFYGSSAILFLKT